MDKLSEMRVGFFSGFPILGAVIIWTGGYGFEQWPLSKVTFLRDRMNIKTPIRTLEFRYEDIKKITHRRFNGVVELEHSNKYLGQPIFLNDGTGGFLLYSKLTKLRKDRGLPLNLENGLFLDPAKENAIKVFSAAGWITLLLSGITALYIVFNAPVELAGNKINSLIILILFQTVLLFSFYLGKIALTRGAYQQPIDKNR
jgi:hypothetical protein